MPLYMVKAEVLYDDEGEFRGPNKDAVADVAIEYFKEEFGAKKVTIVSVEEINK